MSSNDDAQKQVDELIGFLTSPSPEVKAAATEHVAGLTGSTEGLRLLRRSDQPLIGSLCKTIATDPHPKIVEDALAALVNLSPEEDELLSIIDANVIGTLLAALKSPFVARVERSAQLLCNMSGHPRGVAALLDRDGRGVTGLVEAVVFADRLPTDPHRYTAAALVNVAQQADARRFLLEPHRGLVPLLLPQVRDESVERRLALLGTVKNLAFDTTGHEYLLGADVQLAGHLLAPLRSNHPLSPADEQGLPAWLRTGAAGLRAEREADRECRALIADTLSLLCSTPAGRLLLRGLSVYPILRDYEPTETDEAIRDTIWSVVEKLMLHDEPPAAAGPAPALPALPAPEPVVQPPPEPEPEPTPPSPPPEIEEI
jgi:hypothetical protein